MSGVVLTEKSIQIRIIVQKGDRTGCPYGDSTLIWFPYFKMKEARS